MKNLKIIASCAFGLAAGLFLSQVTGRLWLPGRAQSPPRTAGAEEFLRESLLRQMPPQSAESEVLRNISFERLRQEPAALPSLWHLIKQQSGRPGISLDTQLDELLAFRTAASRAVPMARTIEDVDTAGRVLSEINGTLQAFSEKLRAQLESDLIADTAEIAKASSLKEAVGLISNEFDGDASTIGRERRLLAESSPSLDESKSSTEPAATGSSTLLKTALSRAATDLAALRREVDEGRDADQKSPWPAPSNTQVGYTQLLGQADELASSLDSSTLRHLALLVGDSASILKLDDLRTQLGTVISQVTEYRVGRYNLWAIQQIHASEDAYEWPERLGQIDVRILHPTVSALYSMAYEGRVKSLEDVQRPNVVKRLINQPKVGLDQF